jgi:hypothetical protein
LNQISNFQQPKNPSLFYFLFSFSVLACQYSFSYLSTNLILPAIFFSPSQSAVQSNCTFGPPTQFALVILDLQTPATAFDLPGHRVALRCVIHFQHRGAASPPPSSPLKMVVPITSPSLFVHRRCLPPFDCPPSAALRSYKRCDKSTSIIHCAHRLQSLLLAFKTISPSEHHRPPLLSAIVWSSRQLRL